MSKKIIRIVGWSTGDNSFGVTKPYLHYFSQFGNVQILCPTMEMEPCDLLVIPGGADVDPSRYGEMPGYWTTNPDVYKEHFDRILLPQYINAKTCIVGICRGAQSLVTYFGGKLYQHYDQDYSPQHERGKLVHEVVNSKNPKDRFKVNSLHHQAFRELPDCLEELYYNHVNLNVEIFRHKELPIFGVQFHPEETGDQYTTNYIKAMLK